MRTIISNAINLLLKLKVMKNPIIPIKNLNKVPKSILVISNTALGDTLLSIPALKSLKKSFPKSKISLLVNKKIYPLFKDFEFADKLILYHGGYRKFLTTILKLRKQKPEMTLILHSNSPQDIQLAVLCGSRYILKHPTKSKLKHYLSFDFIQKNQHTIDDRNDIVRKIGGQNIYTKMLLNPKVCQRVKNLELDDKIIIGFQLGAADVYKMWQIENFINLAKKLLENKQIYILISGIAKENYLAKSLVNAVQNQRVINTCGKLNLNELAYVLSKLSTLVSNDTGTMHLSIALQTPTICLFSTTNSNISGFHESQADRHFLIQKNGLDVQALPKKQRNNDNMALISVDEVYEAVKIMLKRHKGYEL